MAIHSVVQFSKEEVTDIRDAGTSLDFLPDMDLAAFRSEVRQFLREKLPGDLAYRPRMMMSSRNDVIRWQKILAERGWGAPRWAREFGGAGWTSQQCLVFEEECVAAGTPTQDIVGQNLVGPMINEFGSPAQKSEHIPLILKGDRLWCQGFSERDAGSDLAAISMRAVRQDGNYIVHGVKPLVSHAHQADWIFLLVRTQVEPDRHAGITLLLAELRSPGVTVRPVPTLSGFHHLNEVIFENVRVPVGNLVGNENEGWPIAHRLLDGSHAVTADLSALRAYLWQLKELAGSESVGRSLLIEHREFASRLARLEGEVEAISMMAARVAAMEQAQDRTPAARALTSMLKLRGSELQQRLTEFLLDALGDYGAMRRPFGQPDNDGPFEQLPYFANNIASEMFFRRGATIYGGSSEIQRTIIAKTLFAL